jgi:hypothetical protein
MCLKSEHGTHETVASRRTVAVLMISLKIIFDKILLEIESSIKRPKLFTASPFFGSFTKTPLS